MLCYVQPCLQTVARKWQALKLSKAVFSCCKDKENLGNKFNEYERMGEGIFVIVVLLKNSFIKHQTKMFRFQFGMTEVLRSDLSPTKKINP